jgi:hypothetical protein
MAIDKKAFGLSDSLVSAVNEALKGGQKKLDKNHNGKVDGQDFAILRGNTKAKVKPQYDKTRPAFKEEAENVDEALKGDQHKIDANKNGKIDANDFKKLRGEQSSSDYEKANYKHDLMMLGRDKKKMDEGNPANKAKKNAAVAAVGAKNKDSHYLDRMNPAVADKIRGREKMSGVDRKHYGEEVELVDEAAPAASGVADQMADKKSALQTQIQRKIAQKQMDVMKAKANKRISSIKEGEKKCTCGEGKGSKMSCEVCSPEKKSTKGGKEAIVMNPPLKEASDLPKKVITKGHEIAKSLIKHRSKVREPYAVGMAAAKKSAKIKAYRADRDKHSED